VRQDNRAAWADLWRGRPLIDARGDWQRLADASFYYLHASASVASIASTGVFGLASAPEYHYYRGHVMWDIESFALPPLVLTDPDAARAILGFRSRTLPAARMNAALHGDPGLLYPWEADSDRGDEAVPRWSKADKDHVSLDVGLAFELFANVTGDRLFARLEALPVVAGVAEWLLSRVEATDRGLEIRRVRGPAEAFEPVDNDAWVNLAAITFLRQAAALVRTLGDDPPDAWEAAADAIVIPRDPKTGAIVNHDGFRLDEPLGETPEAAAAFFPLGFRDGAATERATLRYALRHQVERYVGTPMFSSVLGVHAAWLGRRTLAAELFERGYADFFDDPFGAPDEYVSDDDRFPQASPMMANLGGFLGSLLYGLPGLRPSAADPRTWPSRRVILPAGWKAIEVERLWVRGRPTRLVAAHGASRALLEVGERRWIDDGAGRRPGIRALHGAGAAGSTGRRRVASP
jgi:protein-glucosylgalactosylhydroxylysine glucosidase